MAFLEDIPSIKITDFNGARLKPDAYGVPLGSALLARNIAYSPGECGTRLGHSTVFNLDKAASTLFNWLFNFVGIPKNTLALYVPGSGGGVYILDLSNNSLTQIVSTVTAPTGAFFAPAGPRLLMAFHDANGVGVTDGHVFAWSTADEKLFLPPIATAPTFSEPTSGVVTAGAHKLGYLLQTQNGFITKPAPFTSTGFTPVSFTAAGSKTLRMTITTTFPYQATLFPIMTSVANPSKYFVVKDVSFGVPAGAFVATLDINVSDVDLVQGTAADAYFGRVTIDLSGNPPFRPSAIIMYSSRACYITVDGSGLPICYISNKDDYQAISLSLSGILLPGQLVIMTGFAMRGALYLIGPHWTFVTSDNGDNPDTWAKPELVDGAIGTYWIHGVGANTKQGFAWVADEAGLYLFQGGSYGLLPISYYQEPDWKRINWAVQGIVVDYSSKKTVCVYAALDTATSISHVLAWDYTNGTMPEAVQYSGPNVYSYPIGAAGAVQNPTDRHIEEWLAPSAAGYIIRENNGTEAHPYRDVNAAGAAQAIDSIYRPALLPGPNAPVRGQLNSGHAMTMRVKGNGALITRVYSLDEKRVIPTNKGVPTDLSSAPGQEPTVRFSMANVDNMIFELETNAVDDHFTVSRLEFAYTPGPGQR